MGDQAKHYSLKPNEGKALFVLGDVVTRKLSAAETNSAYSLFEIISVPGGGPALSAYPQSAGDVLDPRRRL